MTVLEIEHNRHAFIYIGIPGSGKSTHAQANFNPHEILSADKNRELLNGHVVYTKPLDSAAFRLLEVMLKIQSEAGVLICIDNLNLTYESRADFRKILKDAGYTIHYVYFHDSEDLELCLERNASRPRKVHPDIIRKQRMKFLNAISPVMLERAKTEADYIWHEPPTIVRNPATVVAKKAIVVGDLQGAWGKFRTFMESKGYMLVHEGTEMEYFHPEDRDTILASVGDLVDRGEDSARTLRVFRNMHSLGYAFGVRGNHDFHLLEMLGGSRDKPKDHYNATLVTLKEIHALYSEEEKQLTIKFLQRLPPILKLVTDTGAYVLSHAGVPHVATLKPGTELMPTKYTHEISHRGYRNGTMVGKYLDLHKVWEIADNLNGPKQIHGHKNPSRETPNHEVPMVRGNIICLESSIEFDGPLGYVEV